MIMDFYKVTEKELHQQVAKDVENGEFVSIETQPLVKEDIRVDWDMVTLIERWEDEPTSWWIIEGVDDGGARWEGVGQFTGDFAGNHHELVVVEECVFKGWEGSNDTSLNNLDIVVREW